MSTTPLVKCELQLTTTTELPPMEKPPSPISEMEMSVVTTATDLASETDPNTLSTTTSCDICGKGFSRADNLERHKASHLQSAKLYTCDVCWKSFSRRSYLKLHQRIHSGERPFGCDVCGYAFSRHDHLVIHLRTHQGLKLFNCDLCGKAFSRRYYLKVHRRIHTGERPFKCNLCGYAFSRSDHLLKHKRPNKGLRKLSCVPQPHLIDEEVAAATVVDDPMTVPDHQNLGISIGVVANADEVSNGHTEITEMTVNEISVDHVNFLQSAGVEVTLQSPVTLDGHHAAVAVHPQVDLGNHTNILHFANVSHQIDVHTT